MPKYAEDYEETINELRLQLEELTTECDELRAKLESGVRVEVYRDRYGDLRAHQMKTSAGSEATLLIDDGADI